MMKACLVYSQWLVDASNVSEDDKVTSLFDIVYCTWLVNFISLADCAKSVTKVLLLRQSETDSENDQIS